MAAGAISPMARTRFPTRSIADLFPMACSSAIAAITRRVAIQIICSSQPQPAISSTWRTRVVPLPVRPPARAGGPITAGHSMVPCFVLNVGAPKRRLLWLLVILLTGNTVQSAAGGSRRKASLETVRAQMALPPAAGCVAPLRNPSWDLGLHARGRQSSPDCRQ